MRIIKTKQDIDVLRRAEALPAVLLDLVEDYFLLLRDELEVELESEFCLGSHGYIVVLEEHQAEIQKRLSELQSNTKSIKEKIDHYKEIENQNEEDKVLETFTLVRD